MSDAFAYPDEATAALARKAIVRIGTRVVNCLIGGDTEFSQMEWVCAAVRLLGMVGLRAPQEGHPLADAFHAETAALMRVAVRMLVYHEDGTPRDLSQDPVILAALAEHN